MITHNAKGFTPSETIGQPKKRKMSLTGFTLVEVVVAVVIVAATAAGIFASFIAAQGYVSRARGRISSVNAFRQQVETLRAGVSQETWGNPPNCDPDNNGLAVTATLNCAGSDPGWTGWKNFTGTFGTAPWNGRRCYRVVEVTPGGPRQTEVQINWTEPGG